MLDEGPNPIRSDARNHRGSSTHTTTMPLRLLLSSALRRCKGAGGRSEGDGRGNEMKGVGGLG